MEISSLSLDAFDTSRLSEKIQLGCAAVRLHSLFAILKIKICGEKKRYVFDRLKTPASAVMLLFALFEYNSQGYQNICACLHISKHVHTCGKRGWFERH